MLSFVPKLEKLPSAQRVLWPEFSTLPGSFVLYGGTAIALRLGHRESVDFDFFSCDPFQPSFLERSLPLLKGGVVLQSSANTLTSEVQRAGDGVKLSFFGGLEMKRARDPDRSGDNGVYVASLLDLAATKLKTIWDRASFKDYFDLDVLLQNGVRLAEALGAAKAIYGPSFNPLVSLKALQYFEDGDVARLPEEARLRLIVAVKRVDPGNLPHVEGHAGLIPEGGGK